MPLSVLIKKCRKCGVNISGEVVNFENEPQLHMDIEKYSYSLYSIDSKENKEGFKIGMCKCLN